MEAQGVPPEVKRGRWQKLPTWAKWTIGIVGAFLLMGIGAAIGSGEEDDLKAEVAQITAERDSAEAKTSALLARKAQILGSAKSERARLESKMSDLRSDVDSAEGELAETESSLKGAEKEATLSSFDDGIWQAEVDYAPGTYRTEGGEGCYWATLNSANTGDIADNEVSVGDSGQQIVTISTPYFMSRDCGTWERIDE